MNLLPLLIQVLCGAAGGNIAGKTFQNLDLGPLGNSIAGLFGGGLGGQLLHMLGLGVGAGGSLDLGSIIGSIASGGVGGGVLMAIIGLIRQALAK